jgi:hypothetical protein
MRPLIEAVFRVVALLTAVAGIARLPYGIMAAFSGMNAPVTGSPLSQYALIIEVFLRVGFAYLVWIMAASWAEKMAPSLEKSATKSMETVDWFRVFSKLLGLYFALTGAAGVIGGVLSAQMSAQLSGVSGELFKVFQNMIREGWQSLAQDFVLMIFGFFLYIGKDQLQSFWRMSETPPEDSPR